jgi:hypothetical protein
MKIFRKIVHINNTILSLIIYQFSRTIMSDMMMPKHPREETGDDENMKRPRVVEIVKEIQSVDEPDMDPDDMSEEGVKLWTFLRFLEHSALMRYYYFPASWRDWIRKMMMTSSRVTLRPKGNQRKALYGVVLILRYFEKDLGHYDMVSMDNGVITLKGPAIPRMYDIEYLSGIAHQDDQKKIGRLLETVLPEHTLCIQVVT